MFCRIVCFPFPFISNSFIIIKDYSFFILCYNGKKSLLLLLAERIRTLLAQIQPTFNSQELPLEVIVCGAVADVNDTIESLVGKAERVLLQTDTNRVLVADAK